MTTEAEPRTSAEIGGMGHSVKRKEDPRFIRGQGEYIEDVNLPGQLWLDIVRSPYAHATIKSIDASEALKIPGVAAVVTGKDLEGYKLHWMPTLAGDMQMVLPVDTVMYQSQEVAAVIATSRYAAADGVAAVLVDYEPLPVVVDPHKALEADAPVLRPDRGPDKQNNHIWHWESGDRAATDAALAAADVRIERGHLHPAHPRRLDRDVRLRRRLGPGPPAAHAAHDDPGAARHPDGGRARRRGRRPADLRAEHPGRRPTTSAAGSAARCRSTRATSWPSRPRSSPASRSSGSRTARRTSRPTRSPATTTSTPRWARPRTARSPRLKVKTIADHGYTDAAADPSKFPAGLFNVITGSYDFPNAFVEVDGVYTNKPPGGVAYRCSFRVTEAVHAIERMVDILAHEIGKDPAQLRMENFIQPEQFPYKTPTGWAYDSGNYPAALQKAHGHDRLRRPAQGAGREARARRAHGHRHQQLHRDRRRRAVARLRHPRASRCSTAARSGSTRPARSSRGSASRPRARATRPRSPRSSPRSSASRSPDIKIEYGDTDTAPYGLGTYASRSTPVAGAATAMAARKIRDKARKLAAHLLEAVRGRPRVGARQVQRQGLARPVQDHPGDRVRGLHQPSRRGWRRASRRSTTTTRRT